MKKRRLCQKDPNAGETNESKQYSETKPEMKNRKQTWYSEYCSANSILSCQRGKSKKLRQRAAIQSIRDIDKTKLRENT